MQGSVLDKVTSDKMRKEAYQHPTTLQPYSNPFQSDLRGESNGPGVLYVRYGSSVVLRVVCFSY